MQPLVHKINQEMEVPDKFDQYTLDKLINENDFSVIYGAYKKNSSKKLAIKCYSKVLYPYIQHESIIMEQVRHRHIIKSYRSFHYPPDNPRFFAIVMPRAEFDLEEYIDGRLILSEPQVCRIIANLLDALGVLHSSGIWHRDIKLENILIMEVTYKGPSVVLTDFGLSCVTSDEEIEDRGVGTDVYAAPELLEYDPEGEYFSKFKDKVKYNNKVDIWSLGVVMYCLLSGRNPFYLEGFFDIDRQLKGKIVFDFKTRNPGEMNPFVNVSEEAKDLILSMLSLDPNKRPSAYEARRHPWFDSYDPTDDEDESSENEEEDEHTTYG